jgi:hypothetical protein
MIRLHEVVLSDTEQLWLVDRSLSVAGRHRELANRTSKYAMTESEDR